MSTANEGSVSSKVVPPSFSARCCCPESMGRLLDFLKEDVQPSGEDCDEVINVPQ